MDTWLEQICGELLLRPLAVLMLQILSKEGSKSQQELLELLKGTDKAGKYLLPGAELSTVYTSDLKFLLQRKLVHASKAYVLEKRGKQVLETFMAPFAPFEDSD